MLQANVATLAVYFGSIRAVPFVRFEPRFVFVTQ